MIPVANGIDFVGRRGWFLSLERYARSMKIIASAIVLLLVSAGSALATHHCSLHPKKGATKEELAAMAKVTEADAQKTALASFKDPSKATVKESELEAEHGCLVYSFDIEVAGKTGIQEVLVDAGSGKVLSSKHESAKAEAAEQAKEKSKAPKP
jgi:hypothetical protein